PRADLQADALAHHDGLREPIGEVLRPFDGELEILLRVDLVEPVDRRHEQIGGDRGGLEGERDFSVGAQPAARRHLAVADRVPTTDLLVAGLELRDEVALLEPRAEGRMPLAAYARSCAIPHRMILNFIAESMVSSSPACTPAHLVIVQYFRPFAARAQH